MNHGSDTAHEDLLDVFRSAALSVTKLYKTSASAQAKARLDGYQDCLEDILSLIDKGDVDLRTVRWWIAERLDGREPILPTCESEDETDKTDTAPEPQAAATTGGNGGATPVGRSTKTDRRMNNDVAMQTDQEMPSPTAARRTTSSTPPAAYAAPRRTATPPEAPTSTPTPTPTAAKPRSDSAKPAWTETGAATTLVTMAAAPSSSEPETVKAEPAEATVPMQDVFTFRSSMPYPPSEAYLELAKLDLSDKLTASSEAITGSAGSAPAHGMPTTTTPSPSSTRPFRVRHPAARSGLRAASMSRHGRTGAGQKRKLNFDEIFDLAGMKDVFGRGGNNKRSRQT